MNRTVARCARDSERSSKKGWACDVNNGRTSYSDGYSPRSAHSLIGTGIMS